ncbi:hypothetical protein EDD15DRAFT_2257150 [Pisolithus albus]|nr:hypothetical protein EDD15DRAFT_2257150 [Pisolithus albus]
MGLFDIFCWSGKVTPGRNNIEIACSIVGPSGSGRSWVKPALIFQAISHPPSSKFHTKVYAERCHFEGIQSLWARLPSTPTLAQTGSEKVGRHEVSHTLLIRDNLSGQLYETPRSWYLSPSSRPLYCLRRSNCRSWIHITSREDKHIDHRTEASGR